MIDIFKDAVHITRNMNLDTTVIHGAVKIVHVGYGVNLTKLILPKTVEQVYLGKNNVNPDNKPRYLGDLMSVSLGKGITAEGEVFPSVVTIVNLGEHNDLTKLIIPEGTESVYIGRGNKMEKLIIPESVTRLSLEVSKDVVKLVLPTHLKQKIDHTAFSSTDQLMIK